MRIVWIQGLVQVNMLNYTLAQMKSFLERSFKKHKGSWILYVRILKWKINFALLLMFLWFLMVLLFVLTDTFAFLVGIAQIPSKRFYNLQSESKVDWKISALLQIIFVKETIVIIYLFGKKYTVSHFSSNPEICSYF